MGNFDILISKMHCGFILFIIFHFIFTPELFSKDYNTTISGYVFDKDTNDLKYVWSPNIFMDEEHSDNDNTIAPESYIVDIETKSNFEPVINISEVRISHSIGMTPKIAIKDLLKIYFGYYTLNNPLQSVYSIVYTGQIDFIKASLNHTIVRGSSKIKRLVDLKVILGFTVEINLDKIGYQEWKVDFYLSEYTKMNQIVKYIEKNPLLLCVDYTIGYADLELEINVRNIKQLHDIIEDLHSKFPKIIRNYSYFRVVKIYKWFSL